MLTHRKITRHRIRFNERNLRMKLRNNTSSLSKKNQTVSSDIKQEADDISIPAAQDAIEDIFLQKRKSVKELVSPVGLNTKPLEYMIIADNETNVYTICFYIHKLPRSTKFASTFSAIYNYPNVISSTFIEPVPKSIASKYLDNRINSLETEIIAVNRAGDTNRLRRLNIKKKEAEKWAADIEKGNNSLFYVSFLFVLQDTDLETLFIRASEFHSRAREKSVDLVASYSAHPEAFVSSYPTNRVFHPTVGPVKGLSIKRHIIDKRSLGDIFNHTREEFSHKNGIVIGHNMSSRQLILYDPYDPSHDGYGVVFVGKTGTGKSGSVKMFYTRFIDFGYKIRSIDFEPKGSVGEYSRACDSVGGVNYQVHSKSNNIFNFFELDVEEIYDETTDTEYTDLRLKETLSNLCHLEITLIKDGEEFNDFSLFTFIKDILNSVNSALYDELGIVDGDVDSLYTSELNNSYGIHSGRVKKELPSLTKFYKKVLLKRVRNRNSFHDQAYEIILSAFKEYIRELYYCIIPDNVVFFDKEQYYSLPVNSSGERYYTVDNVAYPADSICGNKPYFDGQSTIVANQDSPWINFDISQLPPEERDVVILIIQNYLNTNCAKRNSQNPKKANKMIVSIDELHRLFHIEEARKFIDDAYRTYRKRNVSPWTLTQFLSDFDGYKETKDLLKNATSIFMLRQEIQDVDFLKRSTPLSDSQIERVCSLGHGDDDDSVEHKGEICLIDNSNKICFLKVDYLTDSEALVVETDINKIKKMYAGNTANL